MAKAAQHTLTAKAKSFVERIENVDKEIETLHATYMNDKRELLNDRKDIVAEAKDAGVLPRVLKDIVKERDLQRSIACIPNDHEPDEAAQYRELIPDLGGPLGEYAARQAAFSDPLDNVSAH
jgi:uncharacterized protein (UPF0335 family)